MAASHNIIDISLRKIHLTENYVDLSLDIRNRIHTAYYRHIELLLPTVYNNS